MVYYDKPWYWIQGKKLEKIGIEVDNLLILKGTTEASIILLFIYKPSCFPIIEIFLQLMHYHPDPNTHFLFHVWYQTKRGIYPIQPVLLSEGRTLYEALDGAVNAWPSNAPPSWRSDMCNPIEEFRNKIINLFIGSPKQSNDKSQS